MPRLPGNEKNCMPNISFFTYNHYLKAKRTFSSFHQTTCNTDLPSERHIIPPKTPQISARTQICSPRDATPAQPGSIDIISINVLGKFSHLHACRICHKFGIQLTHQNFQCTLYWLSQWMALARKQPKHALGNRTDTHMHSSTQTLGSRLPRTGRLGQTRTETYCCRLFQEGIENIETVKRQ